MGMQQSSRQTELRAARLVCSHEPWPTAEQYLSVLQLGLPIGPEITSTCSRNPDGQLLWKDIRERLQEPSESLIVYHVSAHWSDSQPPATPCTPPPPGNMKGDTQHRLESWLRRSRLSSLTGCVTQGRHSAELAGNWQREQDYASAVQI